MNGKRMGPGAPQPDAASARGLTQSQPWPPDPHCAPFRPWLISPLFRARHTPAGPTLSPPRCRSCSFVVTDPRLGGGRRAGSQEEGTLALGFGFQIQSHPLCPQIQAQGLCSRITTARRARDEDGQGQAAVQKGSRCVRAHSPPDAWD